MTHKEMTLHAANVRDNNDDTSMSALIEQFRPMIIEFASRYDRKHHEDAFQDGCIGLLMAARNYRDDEGATFVTFAHRCISGQILRGVASRRPVHVSVNRNFNDLLEDPDFVALNSPASLSAIAGEDGWDITRSPEDVFATVENRDEAESIRRTISDVIEKTPVYVSKSDTRTAEEKKHLMTRAARLWMGLETGERMPMQEVAETIGCGRGQARYMISRVVKRLRDSPRVNALRTC